MELKPPDFSIQYRAVGYLRARYSPSKESIRQGNFITKKETFRASINQGLAKKIRQHPEILDDNYLWQVWLKSNAQNATLRFHAYRAVKFVNNRENYFSIRGQLFDWNSQAGEIIIRIDRNYQCRSNSKISYLWKPNYLRVLGKLPSPIYQGQFWSLDCFLERRDLVLSSSELVASASLLKEATTKNLLSKNLINSLDRSNLMTPARAEITLKFNSTPKVFEVANKRVEFDLVASEGTVFTVNIKAKSWRSAAKKMSDLPNWIAAVKGKLGNATDKGFELIEAGLQVFEVVPKDENN